MTSVKRVGKVERADLEDRVAVRLLLGREHPWLEVVHALEKNYKGTAMKATVALAVLALLAVLPHSAWSAPNSSQTCSGASRAASKAAQDYRNAVGAVDTACNRSSEECQQQRLQANQMLDVAIAANEAMLAICTFTGGKGDDALPVTAETVAAAIDLLPETVLIPCEVFNAGSLSVSAGCPDGRLLNLQETNLTVSTASATSLNYGFNLHVATSIPIDIGPPFNPRGL
jgi:hypothetical protein